MPTQPTQPPPPDGPRVLLPPEVLHDERRSGSGAGSGCVVWHTGLVQGPTGLALTLVVEGAPGDFGGQGWDDFDPLGPAGTTLRGPESPGYLVPFQDVERHPRRYVATGTFGPVGTHDACLEFWVRPLNLHALRHLDEPAAAPSESLLPFLLPPETLYRQDGRVAWHPGLVQGPGGDAHARLEVRSEGGKESELLGPGWHLADRPTGTSLPLRITASSGSGHPVEPPLTVLGSERALYARTWFTRSQLSDATVHHTIAPLDVHTARRTRRVPGSD